MQIDADLWARLAEQAGLPAQGWHAALVSRRRDAVRARRVYRLNRGDTGLALRIVDHPRDAADFAAEVEAHLGVQDRFSELPVLMATDLESQAALMQWGGDQTLFDALATATAPERQRLLAQAGGWLARFHRSGFDERRQFQPKHTFRHLRRLMDEARSGKRAVCDQADWLNAAEAFCRMQPEFEGRQTVSCLGHGDLNLRNLLLSDGGVNGIDFRKGGPVPVGHDVARLLVHFGALLASPVRGSGGLLPGVELAGFFGGYDLAGEDDPSIACLTRMRILIDWQSLPKKTARHSMAEARRYDGLRRLSRAAFG